MPSGAEPTAVAAAHARTLLSLGRADQAVTELSAALASDPQSAELLRLMAQAQLRIDRPNEAWTVATRAVAADPEDEWGHRLVSTAYSELGDHHRAVTAAAEAQRLAPQEWRTHVRRAIASAQAGRAWDGIQAALRAAQLAPNEPDAHFALGFAQARNNNPEEAEVSYQRVLALKPDHAMALNNLSSLQLRRRGGLGDATRGFGAALAVDAQLDVARRNLTVVARRYMRRFHFAVVIAFFVLTASFTSDSSPGLPTRVSSASRIDAALVGGIALLLLFGAIAVLHSRLPRNLRSYFRRLPRNDLWLGLWLAMDVLALLTIAALAVPTTYAGRRSLTSIAWVFVLAGLAISWGPRVFRRSNTPAHR